MFDDIGDKLKSLAVLLLLLSIAAALILFFMMMQESLFMGIVCMVAAAGGGLVSAMLIYGFGELVENSAIIKDKLTAMEKRQNPEASAESSAPSRQASVGTYTIPGARSATSGEQWTCKKCGARNDRVSQYCKDCGAYK